MRAETSPAVDRAIASSPNWSSQLGTESPGPLALLLALLEEEEGRASEILRDFGLSREPFIAEVLVRRHDLPITLEKILRSATFLTREYPSESTISTDFLLVAILDCEPTIPALLETFGLRSAALRSSLLPQGETVLPLAEPLSLVTPAETLSAGRILDVNANRARESLRLLDDYARFVLNDTVLTEMVKKLRHDLVALLEHLPKSLLIEARNTLGDVGTTISTSSEGYRASPAQIAKINLKRLQEALRSLEEYGKLSGPELAADFEKLRYRSYTLEKSILTGVSAREKLADARLYLLLTGATTRHSLDWTIAEAADGGVQIVQLREKTLPDRDLLRRAREFRRWTQKAGVLFIVNDRSDIANLSGADGVHLGQDDMSVSDARKILGAEAIIGRSTHSPEQIRLAIEEGATYIGIGPTFPSTTKEFESFPGLDFIRQATTMTTLPTFAIGGINARTIEAAVKAGAMRVAVSAAIAAADEPRQAAANLCEALSLSAECRVQSAE